MAKQANSTPVVLDPVPIQIAIPSSTWRTPELPRNFFVTGYSPETLDLETPSPLARQTNTAPNNEQTVKKSWAYSAFAYSTNGTCVHRRYAREKKGC